MRIAPLRGRAMPAAMKPPIISAQLAGSGTAGVEGAASVFEKEKMRSS